MFGFIVEVLLNIVLFKRGRQSRAIVVILGAIVLVIAIIASIRSSVYVP